MFNTPLFPRAMTLDTNARQGIDDDVVDLKSPNPKAMSLSRNNGAVPCHQYLTETSKHELDKGDSQLSFAGHFSPARILASMSQRLQDIVSLIENICKKKFGSHCCLIYVANFI